MRMGHSLRMAGFLMLPLVAATEPRAGDVDADRARAHAAVADLGQSLRGALLAKMEEAGPVGAVGFCHDESPAITEAVAQRHGVRIGRVGVRVRNPSNRAEGWVREVIDRFEREALAGAPPSTLVAVERTDLPAGVSLRYARGIGTEAGCLVCHGEAVAEPVMDAIRERYPADTATGFRPGELRGAFWVEVPIGTAGAGRDEAESGAVPTDPPGRRPAGPGR